MVGLELRGRKSVPSRYALGFRGVEKAASTVERSNAGPGGLVPRARDYKPLFPRHPLSQIHPSSADLPPPPFSTPPVLLCIFNSQLCNRPPVSLSPPNLGYRLPPSPIGLFPDPSVPFSLRPTPPSNPRPRRRRRSRRPRSRRPSSTIISPRENLTLPFEGGRREIVLHLFARRNNVDPGVYIGTPVCVVLKRSSSIEEKGRNSKYHE